MRHVAANKVALIVEIVVLSAHIVGAVGVLVYLIKLRAGSHILWVLLLLVHHSFAWVLWLGLVKILISMLLVILTLSSEKC